MANCNGDNDAVKTYERMISPDMEFYGRFVATKANGTRTLVYEDLNELQTGNAYRVKSGQVIRMEQRPSLHSGRTQIIDVLWVTPDLAQWSDQPNTGRPGGSELKALQRSLDAERLPVEDLDLCRRRVSV